LAAVGLAANLYRRTATARDARWFLSFEDLILRFATCPDLAGWRSSRMLSASALRPRWTRDRTVPRGAPVIAATRAAVNPHRSIRVIAIRWLSGRVQIREPGRHRT
jgi:hypothetical protein